MKIPSEIVLALTEIDYFSNIGEPTTMINSIQCIHIPVLDDVVKSLKGKKWENHCLERLGDITSYLSKNNISPTRNETVKAVKAEIIPFVDGRLTLLSYPADTMKVLADNVKFDVLGIAISMVYRQYTRSEFYEQLLSIYKSGHIPCGWHGKLNKGCFLIY